MLLNSRDSIIPAAPHLERQVLLQSEDIHRALRGLLTHTPSAEATGQLIVPKLNNNDPSYLLLTRLVPEGAQVQAGRPIAEVETSKAVEELTADTTGVVHWKVSEGGDCHPGEVLAVITTSLAPAKPLGRTDGAVRELSRAQQQVARTVTTARSDIPDAFVLRRVTLDPILEQQSTQSEPYELLELTVNAIGTLHKSFPMCFVSLVDARKVRMSGGAHVGVTMDAGKGLFVPVVDSADTRPIDEIADLLADFRMRAFRGTFTERQLQGATIALSWNHSSQVVFVQPVIPPGLACAVSVGGPITELQLDRDGSPTATTIVNIGLAHDHRLLNGGGAVAFLDALAAELEHPNEATR